MAPPRRESPRGGKAIPDPERSQPAGGGFGVVTPSGGGPGPWCDGEGGRSTLREPCRGPAPDPPSLRLRGSGPAPPRNASVQPDTSTQPMAMDDRNSSRRSIIHVLLNEYDMAGTALAAPSGSDRIADPHPELESHRGDPAPPPKSTPTPDARHVRPCVPPPRALSGMSTPPRATHEDHPRSRRTDPTPVKPPPAARHPGGLTKRRPGVARGGEGMATFSSSQPLSFWS